MLPCFSMVISSLPSMMLVPRPKRLHVSTAIMCWSPALHMVNTMRANALAYAQRKVPCSMLAKTVPQLAAESAAQTWQCC